MSETRNNTKKITKRSLAIPAREIATPVKPNNAAIRAITRNVIDHPSMSTLLFQQQYFARVGKHRELMYQFETVSCGTKCPMSSTARSDRLPQTLYNHRRQRRTPWVHKKTAAKYHGGFPVTT